MSRHRLLRSVLAAVLVLGLLLPAVAAARGPVLDTVPSAGWAIPSSGGLWDLFVRLLGKVPHPKNGWTIDPDGATVAPAAPSTDNHGTIDPNG
ncbi:MAG TPA: hypothetical protein VGG20_09130 [Thermoanaerobaculia bacterium]|jgi:hypothetical protein